MTPNYKINTHVLERGPFLPDREQSRHRGNKKRWFDRSSAKKRSSQRLVLKNTSETCAGSFPAFVTVALGGHTD